MNITIQSVNFKESKRLNAFIHKKAEKLFQRYPETIRLDFTLKESTTKVPNNRMCALYLSHPGENRFVKKSSSLYEESVMMCIDTMENILRRAKTRKVNKRNDAKRK